MIAPQNEKVFWVFYLVCEVEANCFQGLLPSVHIIAEEEVIRLWQESAILKTLPTLYQLNIREKLNSVTLPIFYHLKL
jgi:hypothetical protein